MRKIAGWMLVCVAALAAVPNAVAGEQEDAVAIVDQAIKAHGGADALKKSLSLIRTGAGTRILFTEATPFADDEALSLPDRYRSVVEFNKKLRLTFVVNGDKGWQTAGGPPMELAAEQLREAKEELYVMWVTTLTPLKTDAFKLSPLPEIKVNGDLAAGVKVVSKNKPDVSLYFDKKTNLLAKIERRATQLGLKVDKEYLYGDYKEFDGVKLPTKLSELINGRKINEFAVATYTLKKLDDSVFAKP